MVPDQPPMGMSGKFGSGVPAFTRTGVPTANLAGVGGRLGLGFVFLRFLATAASPRCRFTLRRVSGPLIHKMPTTERKCPMAKKKRKPGGDKPGPCAPSRALSVLFCWVTHH